MSQNPSTPEFDISEHPEVVELVRVFEEFHAVVSRLSKEQAAIVKDIHKHLDAEKMKEIHQLLQNHSS